MKISVLFFKLVCFIATDIVKSFINQCEYAKNMYRTDRCLQEILDRSLVSKNNETIYYETNRFVHKRVNKSRFF
jgi:hypothetical protein